MKKDRGKKKEKGKKGRKGREERKRERDMGWLIPMLEKARGNVRW